MAMLEARNVRKVYKSRFGGAEVVALRDVSFDLERGEFAAVMGESGSGKTTLLNILAALDTPTSGKVTLDGIELTQVREKELAAFRREQLGFVFQDFNLLDTFSLRDNIFLPLVLAGKPVVEMGKALAPLAETLEIGDILDKYPYEVSGGQKQRAAVARALITGPKLLLADEPTGALDSRATGQLLGLMERVNESGQTILMVTHSIQAAAHAGRVLFIKDGTVYRELRRGDLSLSGMVSAISDTLTTLERGGEDCG